MEATVQDLFAAIGELTVENRKLREMLAGMQAQLEASKVPAKKAE